MIVLVTWRDAHFDREWDGSVREDYLVDTMGYLLSTDSDRFVSIAGERLPDGDGYRAVTHVPVENVVKRQVLSTGETKPKEQTWTS